VLNGSGPPDASTGKPGDFYLDTTADVLYGPASGQEGSCQSKQCGVSWPAPGTSLTGPAGPAGPAGADGTSVTSTALAAGDTNCPDGGSEFTSANGTTYACNGADGNSAGPLGQSGSSAFGNGVLSLSSAQIQSMTLVPGLQQKVTVPAGAIVYVATDGGIASSSASPNGAAYADMAILVDGLSQPDGGFQRIAILNNADAIGNSNWSMSEVVSLSPGTHVISVDAEGTGTGSAAAVSGASGDENQGVLSVLVLRP
jgi:hypothetical protein